jgi:serine/threonine protein kinase
MEPATKRPLGGDKENNVRNVKGRQGDADSHNVANGKVVRVLGTKRALVERQTETVDVVSSLGTTRVVLAKGVLGVIYREVRCGSRRGSRRSTSITKEIHLALVTKHGVTASQLTAECSVLQKLAHLNVVGFRNVTWTKGDATYSIKMELVENQNMASNIGMDTAPAEAEITGWALQIASALKYCHDRGVLHGDLRPENIFLTGSSEAKVVKIVGFEPPCLITAKMNAFGIKRSVYYSPERAGSLPYDGTDDMWAVGCVLLELSTNSR